MSDSEPHFTSISSGDDDSGLLLGRYRMERSLGSGGMGDVLLASDTRLPRKVAIKKVKASLSHDEMVRKRIERECALHATVGTHPHIVTLYDVIDEDGQLNIVLEYVEGITLDQTLKDLAARGERMQRRDAVTIISQVLDALSAIHAQSIVHRDIKPANIMVNRNARTGEVSAKLMDFGIAKEDDEHATQLTATAGTGPGTPHYMAPEQIDPTTFGGVTGKTDVYAVGIVMYQMVSGVPPYLGTLTTVFHKHLNEPPPPLDIAKGHEDCGDLQGIIQIAIAKQPGNRFASASVMRDAVLGVGQPGNSANTQSAATLPGGSSAQAAVTLPTGAATAQAETSPTLNAGDSGSGAGQTQWSGDTGRGTQGRSPWLKRIAAGLVVVVGLAGVGFVGVKALSGSSSDGSAEEPAADRPETVVADETAPIDTNPVIEFAGVGRDPGVANQSGSDASNLLRELRAKQESAAAPEPAAAPPETAAEPPEQASPRPPLPPPGGRAGPPPRGRPGPGPKPGTKPKDVGKEGETVKVGERRWVEE